ncbi:protein CASC1-like, partial [Stegodyphus dumicola]|uniref:protein CASC1-like n=1 Tax=Stegodyphus dumicola TaxID=202533 RepID=UPI0015AAC27B
MPPRKKSIFRRLKSVIKKEKEIIDDVNGDLENKHLEFEDDIQTNEFKKAEESEIKEIQNKKLLSLFEDMNSLFLRKRNINWEKKCWNNYIYQNYDINPLILPEVNAYLTEWDEDEMYDIIQVFRKCRQCSQMCEDIKCALLECPEPEYKVLKSCLESIRNLQCMMRKKIEIATFLILRAANQYVNDETFNIEYGIVDCFEDDKTSPPISLCLWGNLSKNVRHKGIDSSSMEFNFELPPELIKVKCAVRIMHTLFDNVTPTFCESSMPYQWNLGNSEIRKPCSETLLDEIFPRTENELLDAKNEALSTAFHAELTSAVSKQISSMESATASHSEVDKNPIVMFTPPEEPELTILEKSEYFAVGGIYHFDLFYLPYPTVMAGSWIFSHCEEKVLRHIPYQTSIIPIRHPKPDMSPALAAEFADSEIKRFDKEMCSAISLTLKVPDDVLFLEQPLPAFWVDHKKGFTSIGFFETKYDEDTGHISFKTNRFGVIALLQRRYNNMPYQSWELISGNDENSASLAITGMHVALKIKIKSGKCCIENIEQDGKSLFSDVYDIWRNPNLLVK